MPTGIEARTCLLPYVIADQVVRESRVVATEPHATLLAEEGWAGRAV